ncbi:DUF6541 family protein [Microbacterium sp. No. 7]|uniref:DUF6541 family protein n=1 Tax=Microbacterium sp. No. 7 TaxID=1714373 RepID=UPI0006CFAE68|nr:DUF6541 family protein [Microbacterium sp. No. 7]ALJ19393.1 hypothetical protein AOA12_05530 [Microbacterium sp. No. 7]
MSWFDALWPVTVALLVILAPGAVAALLAGLRGFWMLAAAAPLSLAGLAATSMAAIVVPFAWTPLVWGVTVVALLIVATAIGLLARRRGAPDEAAVVPATRSWIPFLAVGVAAALLVPRLMHAFVEPASISQTFDNIYHLNAVRYVLETGAIAPTQQLITGFYPSLWHALTATVAMLSGASIPVAVNAVSLVLAGVVWATSCVWLARQLAGDRGTVVVAAGVLAAAIPAFPLLMLDFGVLYPNVLSLSLLPSALAALVSVTRAARGEQPPSLVRWALLIALVPTIALAHPSTLIAFFWIGVWPALDGLVRWIVRRARDGAAWIGTVAGILAWIVAWVIAGVVVAVARPTEQQAFWEATFAKRDALAHVAGNGFVGAPLNIAVSVLMFAGVVAVIVAWRRLWWLVLSWLTLAFIYAVCTADITADHVEGWRYALTGTWYSDAFRIAALFPTLVVPLAALGAGGVVALVSRLVRGRRPGDSAIVAAIVLVVVAVATQLSPALAASTRSARTMYTITATSPLLTIQERALLERLPQHVPADEITVGSPWTGTSLAFALGERGALVSHIYADLDNVLPPDTATIVERLNQAWDDPEVCAAVERTRAFWVIDFGAREIHNGDHPYPGLDDLADSGVAELVDSEGDAARLYRITACD